MEQAVKAYLVGELSPQPGGGPGAGFGPGMGMGRGRGPPPQPPPDPEGLRERISRLENELAEIKRGS